MSSCEFCRDLRHRKTRVHAGLLCCVIQAGLRPNWAWAWCCSQKRAYFILGIQDRTSPITCDATTLYWTRLHIRTCSSMVPFEIDIKLSAINSKCLNVLIARKESRRPCCRRELPRDVGHLYRKLAPDPLVTQWIERTLKLSEDMGSCRKTTFQCISEGLMHVAAWYHGTSGSNFTKFGE